MCWNGNFMELLHIIFFFLIRLCPFAKFDENSGACSRTLEMLTNLISSLITNSWERFIIPAKQSSAQSTPKVIVGSRNKLTNQKHPLRYLTCGIISLVKIKPNGCMRMQVGGVCMLMRGKWIAILVRRD